MPEANDKVNVLCYCLGKESSIRNETLGKRLTLERTNERGQALTRLWLLGLDEKLSRCARK